MAEVQNSSNASESAAQFIEFVMLQAQNASLFLGLIPNPQSGQPEVNLDLARMFIDQLAMIGEKTRGNLSGEESQVLRNALTNLQMAFFEVSQGRGPVGGTAASEPELAELPVSHSSALESNPAKEPAATVSSESTSGENKKRFSKSYGS